MNKERKYEISAEFTGLDIVPPVRIPESQGDPVDQAQEQIEIELSEQINRIRRMVKNKSYPQKEIL